MHKEYIDTVLPIDMISVENRLVTAFLKYVFSIPYTWLWSFHEMNICCKRDLSFCLNVHALPRCQKLTPIKDNFNEPKNVNDKISPICISVTGVLSQLSIFRTKL